MEKVSTKQIETLKNHGIRVEREISGKRLSTFLSGGVVNYLIKPTTEEELKITLDALNGCQYHLLGVGSNTLITDNGVNTVVITRGLKGYKIDGTTLIAKTGENVSFLSNITAKHNIGGMEFLFGIPGSVGGAVKMNAGAFGSEIKDILTRVKLYKNGKEFYAMPKDISMEYRSTALNGAVVLECEFCLVKRDEKECRVLMEKYLAYRKATQPAEPSLGSVFKRVNGESSAKYIEKLHMKGTKVGNAILSEKHCNFIVNGNGATSCDYIELMERIRERAKTELGVILEPEIKIIKD